MAFQDEKSALTTHNIQSAQDIITHDLGPETFAILNDHPEGDIITDDALQSLLCTPPILMHSGAYFGIKSSRFENAYTKQSLDVEPRHPAEDGIAYYPEADMEARALGAVYRHFGHDVTYILPQPGAIDGIFCTDSDKTFQGVTPTEGGWKFGRTLSILPRFTHEIRQLEVPWKERLLAATQHHPDPMARRHIVQMKHQLEFGDTRVAFHRTKGKESGFVLAGIAESNEIAIGRSTLNGHEELRGYLKEHIAPELDVVTIHLKQPFYHMDTSGPNTFGGHMFTHPAAYAPESWDTLKQIFGDKLVELPLEDIGLRFGGNATNFGNRIHVSAAISERTARIMAEHGYDVILTPIPHTMLSGGGHRCMTSVNPHIYVPGGYDIALDSSRSGTVWKVDIDYAKATIHMGELEANGKITHAHDLTHTVSEFAELYHQQMAIVTQNNVE